MSLDHQYQAYLRYYDNQQRGGQFVAFRGARRWQKGDGFGDVLRGIFRWFLPVISSGASTFIKETAAAQARGDTLGDAAKSALRPTLGTVIGAVGNRIQGGSGRRRRVAKRSRKRVYKASQKGGKGKSVKKRAKKRAKKSVKKVRTLGNVTPKKRKPTRKVTKAKKAKKGTRPRTIKRKQKANEQEADEQSYNF